MQPDTQPGRFRNAGRTAAISAVILLVSLGLCGVSIYAFPNDYVTVPGMITGVGMLVGVGGLIVAAVKAVVVFFTRDSSEDSENQ